MGGQSKMAINASNWFTDIVEGNARDVLRPLIDIPIEAMITVFMKDKFSDVPKLVGSKRQKRLRTKSDYEKTLGYLTSWLKEADMSVNIIDLTPAVVDKYIIYTMSDKPDGRKGCSPATVNIRLRLLKVFFKFVDQQINHLIKRLMVMGELKADPEIKDCISSGVKLLKNDRKVPHLPEKQIQLLLAQPKIDTYSGFRDYTIMGLMIDSGPRVSECVKIRINYINFNNNTIYLPGDITKNGEPRTIIMSRETTGLLKTLVEMTTNTIDGYDNENGYIFVSQFAKRAKNEPLQHISATEFSRKVNAYGKKAEITNIRVSPHTLRHSFATLFEGSMADLKELLGHKSLDMVMIYKGTDVEHIAKTYEAKSPMNRVRMQE
jgi:integrase/recombinase XerD